MPALFSHQNNKAYYYLKSYLRLWLPTSVYRKKLNRILANAKQYDGKLLEQRVGYYNKMLKPVGLPGNAETIGTYFKYPPKKSKVYFFDTYEYIRYFNPNFRFFSIPGDVVKIPLYPSIVKSRPILGDNENSVLLNLNKIRHFLFVNDDIATEDKLSQLVWRGNAFIRRTNRTSFLQKYYGHPMCNIGKVNKSHDYSDQWLVSRMTICEQLKYKYILCLEGNDVATNLKWVMSSNSVAVMPRPKFETWFMEGTLIPNVHYIQIADDYSNLEEKIHYYEKRPAELQQIINNAHRHVSQFLDADNEDIIALLVLQKYFELTTHRLG